MNATLENWKDQLKNLAPDQRAELAHFLLASLDDEEGDVESAWDAEASRRVEEIRSGKAKGRLVEEFLDELRTSHP